MRQLVLIGLLSGCTHPPEVVQPDAEPPAAWASGAATHAIVWSADGFASLAGRIVPSIGFACQYDPEHRAFVDCPASTAMLGYADTNCTMRIFPDDGHGAFLGSTRFLLDAVGTIYSVEGSGATMPFYYSVVNGSCQQTGWSNDRLEAVTQWRAADLDLDTMTQHAFNGVGYTTLETSDGFSVVVSIAGEVTRATDTTSSRLRNVYDELGGVRSLAGIYDADLNEMCTPAQVDSSAAMCIPTTYGDHVYADFYFGDSTCHGNEGLFSNAKGWFYDTFDSPSPIYICDEPNETVFYQPMPGARCVRVGAPAYHCRLAPQLAQVSWSTD